MWLQIIKKRYLGFVVLVLVVYIEIALKFSQIVFLKYVDFLYVLFLANYLYLGNRYYYFFLSFVILIDSFFGFGVGLKLALFLGLIALADSLFRIRSLERGKSVVVILVVVLFKSTWYWGVMGQDILSLWAFLFVLSIEIVILRLVESLSIK